MNCILNIAGKTSNDIYQLNVPSNLLGFCKFDFTRFMEESTRLCLECMKTGEYPIDEVNVIRNSITTCHRYYENNVRGLFDKIVVDCWIEYICRQGEMGTSTLWNSFAECKNSFQKVIFQRLSEYRAHRAINQWVNLLKMQEYAQKKLEYVFGGRLNGVNEAAARLNFFDLMFSVAANEQGYSLDTVSSIKVCKPGRLSSAPFVYSGAAKEIIRNLFKNVRFAESQPYVSREEGAMSDWEAMDAFSMIKSYLPDNSDNVVKTIMKTIVKLPETVYMPSGFKAVIDLEIDAILNSGAFLQRCRRCNEFYVRDKDYTSDYCDNPQKDGSTCRSIMEQPKFEPPTAEELDILKEKSDNLYKEISERVGKDIAQKDFIEWLGYFNVIKGKVFNGEARPSDFDDFVVYTNQFSFPPAAETEGAESDENADASEKEEEKKEEEVIEISADGKKIKPYQFTKINRKELEQSGLLKPAEKKEESAAPAVKETAAVAPPPPQVAKIIRGGAAAVFRELPARPISNGDTKEEQPVIKKDVYLGEDFSLSVNKDKPGAPAAASYSGLPAARNNEPAKKPGSDSHFLPDLDQFTDFSDIEEPVEVRKPKAPKVKLPDFGKPAEEKIPTDGEGFKDLTADSRTGQNVQRHPKSDLDPLFDMIFAPFPEQGNEGGGVSRENRQTVQNPGRVKEVEYGQGSGIIKEVEYGRDSERPRAPALSLNPERLREPEIDQKPVRLSEPELSQKPERLSEPELSQKPVRLSEPELSQKSERLREQETGRNSGRIKEWEYGQKAEREESRKQEPDGQRPRSSAYSRYSANNAYSGSRINPVHADNGAGPEEEIQRTGFGDMEDFTEEASLITDKTASEKEKPVLTGDKPAQAEHNRAARAVSAYKTVTDMPVSRADGHFDKASGSEKPGGVSEDFARILDSIERNDGFEEENLPLDPDGVPLSHKTKHVMDAIMKNTGVSPSLIYGRRQAAAENVVLDESFGENKKK